MHENEISELPKKVERLEEAINVLKGMVSEFIEKAESRFTKIEETPALPAHPEGKAVTDEVVEKFQEQVLGSGNVGEGLDAILPLYHKAVAEEKRGVSS